MILIVDDHLDTGTALARMLKKFGHDAIAVNGAAAALKLLETLRPGVIVLDLMMPQMSGLELLQRVRSDTAMKDVPVVIFSADYTLDSARQAREQGAQEYIVKGTMGWEKLCAVIGKYAAAAARAPQLALPAQGGLRVQRRGSIASRIDN